VAIETNYIAAFLVALLGGMHCFSMCGGIVGALTLGLPPSIRARVSAILPYQLAYNGGRLISYTMAGFLMGGMGAWAVNLAAVHYGQQVLRVIAGLFMVLLGLYLGGWWRGLIRIEQIGGVLWRRIEPLGRRLLPVRTLGQALGIGLVWGWLPCGLVYSVLVWSISAGGAVEGALLMLSFGLGTLPAVLAIGTFAASLANLVRKTWVRYMAGVLVIVFGIYQLVLVW
jgi:sulfite exporter TauE/SafE